MDWTNSAKSLLRSATDVPPTSPSVDNPETLLAESRVEVRDSCEYWPLRYAGLVEASGPQRPIWHPRTFGSACRRSALWCLAAAFQALTALSVAHAVDTWGLGVAPGTYWGFVLGLLSVAIVLTAAAFRYRLQVLKNSCRTVLRVFFDNAAAARLAEPAVEYDNDHALQALRVLARGDETSPKARRLAAGNLLRLRALGVRQKSEREELEAAVAAEVAQLDEQTNLLKGLPDELTMNELAARLDFEEG